MPVITFIEFDGTQHQVDSESGLSVMEMAMKHDIPMTERPDSLST